MIADELRALIALADKSYPDPMGAPLGDGEPYERGTRIMLEGRIDDIVTRLRALLADVEQGRT